MITNQIMKRDFLDNKISQRTKDSFFNATELMGIYNSLHNENKRRIADFWENENTKQIYLNLLNKLKIDKLHESTRGRNGATWMHEELFIVFYNWLNKIPNQSITRDETTFCLYIEESFEGILFFERQKKFDTYYVDLYCEEIQLCIEFDEEYHDEKNKIKLDKERQLNIENKFNVNFIRHKIKDNFSKCINSIIRYKESYNLVQSIKNNNIPKNGFL